MLLVKPQPYEKAPFSHQEISLLVKQVHQGLWDSELFNIGDIKTRAIACEYYQVGEYADAKFVHINIAIMPGRTEEQISRLLSSVSVHIKAICNKIESLTIEVKNINKASYFKK